MFGKEILAFIIINIAAHNAGKVDSHEKEEQRK